MPPLMRVQRAARRDKGAVEGCGQANPAGRALSRVPGSGCGRLPSAQLALVLRVSPGCSGTVAAGGWQVFVPSLHSSPSQQPPNRLQDSPLAAQLKPGPYSQEMLVAGSAP